MLLNIIVSIILLFGNILVTSRRCLYVDVYEKTNCNSSEQSLTKRIRGRSYEILREILEVDGGYKLAPNILKRLTRSEPNYSIRFNEIVLYGIDDIKVQYVNHFKKKRVLNLKILIPIVHVTSNFEVTGKILGFPIDGKGNMQFVVSWTLITANAKYDLIATNGSKYATFPNGSHRITIASQDIEPHLLKGYKEGIEQQIYEVVKIIINDLMNRVAKQIPLPMQ